MAVNGVNDPLVREQARVFYSIIVAKKEIINPPKFNASMGWLAKFKNRCKLQLIRTVLAPGFDKVSEGGVLRN